MVLQYYLGGVQETLRHGLVGDRYTVSCAISDLGFCGQWLIFDCYTGALEFPSAKKTATAL